MELKDFVAKLSRDYIGLFRFYDENEDENIYEFQWNDKRHLIPELMFLNYCITGYVCIKPLFPYQKTSLLKIADAFLDLKNHINEFSYVKCERVEAIQQTIWDFYDEL